MKSVLLLLGAVLPIAIWVVYITAIGLTTVTTTNSVENSPSSSPTPWPVYRLRTGLADFFQSAADALTPPNQHAVNLQSLYWKPTILRALTSHPDLLDAVDGQTDCRTIAKQLGLHADFTCRFLRAGTSLNLLTRTKNDENVYKLTATGEFLRRNNPDSVADVYDLINSKLFQESLHAAATKSIKTGRSGVHEAFGIELFDYFNQPQQSQQQKREGEVFDSAMNQISKNIAMALIYDWTPHASKNATVCDIGGGKGTIITALCKKHAGLKGILFDLPESTERAKQYIADSGLSDRIDVVSGDFFAKLPTELGACDVFYLKAIFHDWDDDASVSIIKNIKAVAKNDGAKIAGHDIILGIGDSKSIENRKIESDVTMMAVCLGGRERTKDEYFALFEQAGIESKPRLIKLRDLTSVVEVDL